MSLTLKLGTLAIRTLAKPIANTLKANAREHERFRNFCVTIAQTLHRIDIRLRLGLLQDSAAIDRQIKREIAEVEARRARSNVPTAKTEQQVKWDKDRMRKEIKDIEDKAKALPKVKPLSENKAIETGANFLSEGFLFIVAGGIIIFEYTRQRRKESDRRDEVADRLDSMEIKIDRIESALLTLPRDSPVITVLKSAIDKAKESEVNTSESSKNIAPKQQLISSQPTGPSKSSLDREGNSSSIHSSISKGKVPET